MSEWGRGYRSYQRETTACGRTNHRVGVPCEVSDLPIVGGRTRAIGVDQSSRRTRLALIQRTHRSCVPTQIGVTAFDEWNCRADVACVGADLRVRPQNRLRSSEDGRTHRSAPTVGAPTPPSGSPEEMSTEFPKREKNFAFYLHMNLESRSGLERLMSGIVVLT